jgi:hypothetical protein
VDENTRLLLQKANRGLDWEDEERANYDQETLRQKFRERLYGGQVTGSEEQGQDEQADRKDGAGQAQEALDGLTDENSDMANAEVLRITGEQKDRHISLQQT